MSEMTKELRTESAKILEEGTRRYIREVVARISQQFQGKLKKMAML